MSPSARNAHETPDPSCAHVENLGDERAPGRRVAPPAVRRADRCRGLLRQTRQGIDQRRLPLLVLADHEHVERRVEQALPRAGQAPGQVDPLVGGGGPDPDVRLVEIAVQQPAQTA